MRELTPEERAELGIPIDARVVDGGAILLSEDGPAQGFVAAQPALAPRTDPFGAAPLRSLVTRKPDEPQVQPDRPQTQPPKQPDVTERADPFDADWIPEREPHALAGIEAVSVKRDADASSRWLVGFAPGAAIVVKKHARVVVQAGGVLLDASWGPVNCRLRHWSGPDVVICASRGTLQTFTVHENLPADLGEALDAAFRRPAPTITPPPELTSAIDAGTQAPWLAAVVRAGLVSERPGDQAAAVGLAYRFWQEPALPAGEVDAVAPALLDRAESGVHAAIRRWAGELDGSAREAIARRVVEGVVRLERDLDDLRMAVSADRDDVPMLARAWLLRRDDLESLAAILDWAGGREPIEAELAHIDALGQDDATLFLSAPGAGDDDRLRAVAAFEPWQWWSELAEYP